MYLLIYFVFNFNIVPYILVPCGYTEHEPSTDKSLNIISRLFSAATLMVYTISCDMSMDIHADISHHPSQSSCFAVEQNECLFYTVATVLLVKKEISTLIVCLHKMIIIKMLIDSK